ncbi:hypothetical protein LES60_03450 [Pectobacterium brasiliense]|uniref:hypothetical protein n=1 Tax=Pectobacterium brasiliense TaxID=180957 RepID=UPI001CE1A3F4|nr:hypothetical protein [Pectobacterium brasiliense]MCA5919541.1 hypothetical protein [Pectobacterium brasiliense]MCA5925720.1 hypothetical protein [Pectobacterium brasiliense]MCA5935912.1 hypothetical protein [Pectobacterium brasiliense]MCA5939697.1 hypothetical protein [Pectobacterium brasiliense]MCA5942758.1 hypothetical protein [Pectobacterium brasiliense]
MIDKNGGCEDSHCRFFYDGYPHPSPFGPLLRNVEKRSRRFFIGTVVGAGVNDGHEKTKAVSLMKKKRR